MVFPRNDLVRARAISSGYRTQYNESLFDILGEVVTGSTLSDRIRVFTLTGNSIIDLINSPSSSRPFNIGAVANG